MTIILTITTGENDSGPFDIYVDVDGYTTPVASGITYAQLVLGYQLEVDDNTIQVKIVSTGLCVNEVIAILESPCFTILPSDNNYILSQIIHDDFVYLYGYFTGYNYGDLTWTRQRIMKINSDLTLDQTYDTVTGPDEVWYEEAQIIQQWWDDKIIMTGTFSTYKGFASKALVRINTDGSYDNTYDVGSGFTGTGGFTAHGALDSQGRLIVGGLYDAYDGNSSPRLARINQDGLYDNTLVVGTGFNNTTQDILMSSAGDDSFFVTGYFDEYKGVACPTGIIKLTETGDVDVTFDGGIGFTKAHDDWPVYMLRIPGETSFYCFGRFIEYKGIATTAPGNLGSIIKLTEAGDLDLSFDSGTGFASTEPFVFGYPSTGYIIWGDKILIRSWEFTSYNGIDSYWNIILNSDGSVYYAFSPEDGVGEPIIIGNDLFVSVVGECIRWIHTFIPPTTTTTTTDPAVSTTTSTTTITPTTTTTTTQPPTTTTTTTAFVQGNNSALLDLQSGETYDLAFIDPISGQIVEVNLPNNLSGSEDTAHTTTKLYQNNQGVFNSPKWDVTLRVWDIVIEPWNAVFDRDIIVNACTDELGRSGLGLVIKSSTILIGSFCPDAGSGYTDPWEITEIDITDPDNPVTTRQWDLPWASGGEFYFVAGDFLYVPNSGTPKLIVTTEHWNNTTIHLMQFDYATGNLEINKDITADVGGTYKRPFGLFEHSGKLYLSNSHNTLTKIYEIALTTPWGLTEVQEIIPLVAGASQIPSAMTEILTPTTTTTTTT